MYSTSFWLLQITFSNYLLPPRRWTLWLAASNLKSRDHYCIVMISENSDRIGMCLNMLIFQDEDWSTFYCHFPDARRGIREFQYLCHWSIRFTMRAKNFAFLGYGGTKCWLCWLRLWLSFSRGICSLPLPNTNIPVSSKHRCCAIGFLRTTSTFSIQHLHSSFCSDPIRLGLGPFASAFVLAFRSNFTTSELPILSIPDLNN